MGPLEMGGYVHCENTSWLWEILQTRKIQREQEDRMIKCKTPDQRLHRGYGEQTEWRKKAGPGSREIQVPIKKTTFPLQIPLLRTCNSLWHGQIPCVHMRCVKAGTQKVPEKVYGRDAWRLEVWKWRASFQIFHHQQIYGWLPQLKTFSHPSLAPAPEWMSGDKKTELSK